MAFWSFTRRGSRRQVIKGAPVPIPSELEPIQLFTAAAVVHGWIVSHGDRVTDLLNERPSLRVLSAADGAPAAAGSWQSITREGLLVVAPPPHIGQQGARRRRRLVQAKVGPYVVTGAAHLAPGAAIDLELLRGRQHFLPMTTVTLRRGDDPAFEQQLAVALVNIDHVVELRHMLTIA